MQRCYSIGSRMGVEERHIKFTLLPAAYSIDNFNVRVKVALLQQIQDWEAPQIRDLKLVIPEHFTFMPSNSFFIALGILSPNFERLHVPSEPYHLAHTKHL